MPIHLSFSGIDLKHPRLKPITRSWLLGSGAFSHEPHPGCLKPHFKQFLHTVQMLRPPPSVNYECLLTNTWLRLSGPTREGMASYRSWVAQGCPDVVEINPIIPDYAFESAFATSVMGLLCWDGEMREFMDVRQAASSFPTTGVLVGHSILQDMINNFEDQLTQRMAAILLERKRLTRKISLLTEALTLSQSIIDTCYD